MAKKIKFELNEKGVRELMLSKEMGQVLTEYGKQVADNANGMATGKAKYKSETPFMGENRLNVSVEPANKSAHYDNLKNNTILKALRPGS